MTFNTALILKQNPWLKDVRFYPETPSTQIEAKNSPANILHISSRQTATYGRFGRPYFAPESGGIYMSVHLEARKFDHIQITLLAAAAVVTALEKLTNKKPTIKWVNDIYLEDRKIIGILAEGRPGQIVLGMGINFQVAYFPDLIADRAGSLFDPTELAPISRSQLVSEIWAQFDKLQQEDYLSIYRSHLFILGMTVSFNREGKDLTGQASGLTQKGELLVTLPDGEEMALNSGEISLKKWTP